MTEEGFVKALDGAGTKITHGWGVGKTGRLIGGGQAMGTAGRQKSHMVEELEERGEMAWIRG